MRQPFRVLPAAILVGSAIAPGGPVSAAEAATVIGTATFDAGRTAIAIPYRGPAPTIRRYELSKSHYYYEFSGARLARDWVQHHLIGDTIVRYTMANRPGGTIVRISFVLIQPGAPSIRVDERAHRIVLLPLGREVATHGDAVPVAARPAVAPPPRPLPPPPAVPVPSEAPQSEPSPAAAIASPEPTPKLAHLSPVAPSRVVLPHRLTPPTKANHLRTVIGRPFLDDYHHRLVLPFTGPAPEYAIKIYDRNPRWVYMDFDQSMIKFEGPHFDTYTGSAFDGWLLSSHGPKARLYLKFKNQVPVVAQVYPESGEIWFSAEAVGGAASTPKAAEDAPASPAAL